MIPLFHESRAKLQKHFSDANRILKDDLHLYQAHPAAVGRTRRQDPQRLSFFNPSLVYSPDARRTRALADSAAQRPRWIFILASRDYDVQVVFHGKDWFVDVVIAKIRQTLDAGRHPVIVAPYDLVQTVIERMPPTEGVTLLTFCPFQRFLTLLMDAELAFYWNIASHSALLRLLNRLPVIMLDRGHLVRNVRPLYERMVDWYYQGQEPMYVDQGARFDARALSTRVHDSRGPWSSVAAGFARSPTPADLVAEIVRRG